MADQTTQFIVGDVAIDALTTKRKRRFFRSKKQREPLTNCENCDAPLTGEYCSQCGQHAIDYRRSLMRLMIDAADSLLNWDTKFLNTVVVLLLRPWRLTNDFNAGRRVRYVHPLRLYLIASIAFFLLAKLVHLNPGDAVELSAEDRAQIAAALGKLTGSESQLPPEQRVRIEAARARWAAPETIPDPKAREKFERAMMKLPRFADKKQLKPQDIAKIEAALARLEKIAPPNVSSVPPPIGSEASPAPPMADGIPRPDIPPVPDVVPRPGPAHGSPTPARSGSRIQFNTDGDPANKSPFEKWMEERIKAKIGEDGTNVQLFLETLRNNIPTMMLFCIPLFALVLKILYVRQRRYYIEHLVYALHIHSFVYVAVIVISLVSMGLERSVAALQVPVTVLLSFTVAGLVFLSIRRVYRQGWFMTVLKFFVGAVAYWFVLVSAIVATAFVTLLLP
jgi:hypothetical protein